MGMILKSINKEINLNNKITLIISETSNKYINIILSNLKNYEIIINPKISAVKKIRNDIILIGNLVDNLVCEYLYQKMIISADKRYPGSDKFEIRTLIKPINQDSNIAYIGYSNESGLIKGLKKLKELVDNKSIITYISYSNSTVLPIDKITVDKIKSSDIPREDIIYSIHTSYWWLLGYLAHLEDNKDAFKKYDKGLSSFIKRAKNNPGIGTNMHLHMVQHVVTIWALEHAGYYDNNTRQKLFEVLYNWANGEEGIGYIKEHNITGKTVCHNHTLFCALSLKILSELFTKRCEYDSCFKQWNDYADLAFSSFNRGGWKPLCDDSAYSVEVTLVLASIYSLFEEKHLFLNSGGYKSLEWLKAIIGNDGYMPSFGDGTTYNPSAVVLMKIFSYWYKDRELIALLNKLPDDIRYKISVLCNQNYDIDLKEKNNIDDTLKLNIINADDEIYYCYDNSVEEARYILDKKPTYPIAECFDKISIRNSDIFLLIDGLSSPYTHAYHDGGGLINFTFNNVIWLVEENCYRWPETEHCNMITITKDGGFEEPDPFAKLIKTEQYEFGAYVAIEVDEYNNCLWQREYILIKDLGLIIRDVVTIKQNDEYVICFHAKTPTIGKLEGNTFKVQRYDDKNNEHIMTIRDCNNYNKSLEIINIGEKLFMCGDSGEDKGIYNHGSFSSEMGVKAWKNKYCDETFCVSHLETRISGFYKKNEQVVMTHMFMIDNTFKVDIVKNKLTVKGENKNYIFNVINCKNIVNKGTEKKQTYKENKNILEKQITCNDILEGITINAYIILLHENNIINIYKDYIKIKEIVLSEDINNIGKFNNNIIIGTKQGNIYHYSVNGNLIWSVSLNRIPSIYATWETNYFEVTAIKEIINNHISYLAIGTGDNQIKLMDTNGKLLWSSYIYATIPNKIFYMDIDNDRKKEIITIGSESMNAGCVYNFNFDGSANIYPRIGGWLNNIIDISENKKFILCGLKYGENLILFKKSRNFENIFKIKLGGKVNGVILYDEKAYAITSKGYLLKYSITGKREVMLDLNSGAIKFVIAQKHLIIETLKGISICDLNCTLKYSLDDYKILNNQYIYNKEHLFKMNSL